MIEIHLGDNIYMFEEPRYQTRSYSYAKYKAYAHLLNKNLDDTIANNYSTYYAEVIINHCIYDDSIMNKLKSFGFNL
jgi:hypothetical protein